jgi:YfiH family protein
MNIFKEHPNVIAGISKKEDGSCRLWPDEALNQRSFRNREGFFKKLNIAVPNVLGSVLTHSNNVMTVGTRDRGRVFNGVDGFVTKEKDVFLSVTVADCLPVFLYDPVLEAVSLLHAGWRGLDNGIIAVGMRKMEALGSDPRNILAAIGPHIKSCHFEVKEDTLEHFLDYPEAKIERDGKYFLDLETIAETQLRGAGLESIEKSGECTACLPAEYFSYRMERPTILEAMVAVIGLK